eukprot:6393348-Amphidinium_carterae.1
MHGVSSDWGTVDRHRRKQESALLLNILGNFELQNPQNLILKSSPKSSVSTYDDPENEILIETESESIEADFLNRIGWG